MTREGFLKMSAKENFQCYGDSEGHDKLTSCSMEETAQEKFQRRNIMFEVRKIGGKASELQAKSKATRNDQVRFECNNNPNYCQKLPGLLMTSNVP